MEEEEHEIYLESLSRNELYDEISDLKRVIARKDKEIEFLSEALSSDQASMLKQ